MSFTYRHGDRPLQGYTILRGIGRGGFGEVYYAVSDGGREVALKSIHQNHEIELRGVRQCMNLKCPQLVTIFDVHEGAGSAGTPGSTFIVMEYIEGPSLRDLLEQSPGGVSEEKAAFLVLEIARGLAYLHENGIVHRDLKPENLFYEDGYVKIGDYGLSKFISMSHQSGQTISVGTVHYMAPEIGSGNYQRGIDLYALGVILYELLTGRVPFDGTTMGEILMKHIAEEPDVSKLGPVFQRVVHRALRKKPEDRYPDASSLAADLVSDRGLAERVATVGAGDFSRYTAGHVREAEAARWVTADSRKVLAGETVSARPVAAAAATVIGATGAAVAAEVAPVLAGREEAADSAAKKVRPGRAPARLLSGERGARVFLCGVTMLMASVFLDLLVSPPLPSIHGVLFYLGSIVAGAASVFLIELWAAARFRLDTRLSRRFAVTVAAAAFLVPGYTIMALAGAQAKIVYSYLPALLAGLFFIDWEARVRRDRSERILLSSAFGAAVVGFVLSLLLRSDPALVVAGVLASISLALNIGAPFPAGRVEPEPESDASWRRVAKELRRAERSVGASPERSKENVGGPASASGIWENVVEFKERMRSAARSSPNVLLIRPRREAILGGVCAGLARYMDVGTFAVRVTFFLFALLTWGWALLAYLIFWIRIPAAEGFDITPRTAAAAPARRGASVRAALSSSFALYLQMVLGLGGGLTLLIAAAAGNGDVLGLGLDTRVAAMAGCLLLIVAVYRCLEMLSQNRRAVWRAAGGGLVFLGLVAVGLTAVGALTSGAPAETAAGLKGWGLAITWAVALLSARLAVEAPGLFLRPVSPASGDSDPGQPPGLAAWGLLGTTFVLAGALIGLVGVATTTGLAEAVFTQLKIERYSAFIEFGQHSEHFLIGLVLFLPGLFCHLAARRWGGGLHVLRGTVGLVAGGLVLGSVALFAPEYVHVSSDFDVVLTRAVSVEATAAIYLLLILSFGCLKWPGRSVQWKGAAPLAGGGTSLVVP